MMNIETKPATVITITDINAPPFNLDPVRVIFENYAPGRGRVIVTCWDRAWVAAWSAMGGGTTERFFLSCTPDYLVSNLNAGLYGRLLQRQTKQDDAYLRRIVEAVQAALRQQARQEVHGEGVQ
jgi:hypothetical protein